MSEENYLEALKKLATKTPKNEGKRYAIALTPEYHAILDEISEKTGLSKQTIINAFVYWPLVAYAENPEKALNFIAKIIVQAHEKAGIKITPRRAK